MKRRSKTGVITGSREVSPSWGALSLAGVLSLFLLMGCDSSNDADTEAEIGAASEAVAEGRGGNENEATVADVSGAFSPLEEFEVADQAFEDGLQRFNEGKYGEALALFEKAVRVDTENEEIEYHIAYCLSRLKRPDEAILHYKRTVEIYPDFSEAHNNLGNLLMNKGAFQAAEVHFRRAIEIVPDEASAHNNLGSLLSRQGRVGEAIPLFVKAIQLNPNYVEARCNLGNAYLIQGRANESLLEFSRALEIRPNFRPAVVGVQRARVKLGTIQVP